MKTVMKMPKIDENDTEIDENFPKRRKCDE